MYIMISSLRKIIHYIKSELNWCYRTSDAPKTFKVSKKA